MVTLLLCVGVVMFLAGIVLVVVGLCVAAGVNEADDVGDPLAARQSPHVDGTSPQLRQARAALVNVRAGDVNRQLELMARRNPDLALLPRRLEDLYLIEVER